jgi:hypothetical protein
VLYHLFGLFWGYNCVLSLGKVQITTVIMLKFLGTNEISLVLISEIFWIIFVALCLKTVLSARFARELKKLWLPPWQKWRTSRLFQRGISSEQILW